jgi:uncharacterized protein involved in exopolysaccharide biosynthesis
MAELPSGLGLGAEHSAPAESTTLLQVLAAVLTRWRLILLLGVVGAVIAAAWSLLLSPRYRVATTFALDEPQMPAAAGGLALLAGEFGGMPNGGRSLEFYSQLLTGRTLLGELVSDSFTDPASGRARPLYQLVDAPGDSIPEQRDAAIRLLAEDAVHTSTNDQTGTVTYDVSLGDAHLAAAVAKRMFDLLVRFNTETRNSAASERRRFAERELARTKASLSGAEEDLRAFLERNREGLNSPRLALQQRQLQRQIDVLVQVNSQLAGEVQQARIDEVRDTPALTLVEVPEPPLRRDSPKRKRMTMVGLLLGLTAGIVVAAFSGFGEQLRTMDPIGYQRMRQFLRRQRPSAPPAR